MSESERPGRAYLKQLLAERNEYADRVPQIDALIRETFERRVAILVLDMTGFSRTVAKHGIIHYLAMIQQMETAAVPAVEGNNGLVIKQEADNLLAIFDEPGDALEASLDIFRAFEAINSVVPEDRDLKGCVGIGFGDALVIGEEDLFGHEMNLASKLGEDLAEASEILLTEAAFAALPPHRYVCTPRRYEVSGLLIDCYIMTGRVRATGRLDLGGS
jgi:class 3 adenylate cyclase